ncbi:helix-turn-helix domain-containing protein [Sphingopyxis alaskensis]|uniref:helix-turn-helix domain-containing protein n=1 Tax=Sphingopyxis alaskensis TaxID=117207 RepID=UPI002041F77C|nr:helix-turn-helix domain-containing protein [Sphingopyxis alaskensis]MCM3419016.1 helix-turn-helix domain-containing protein [Sphingopyxis alaskensis]
MTNAPISEKSDKTSVKSESQALSGADAIGLRIRNSAREKNLSQADLCRKAALKAQTLSGYWMGKTVPKAPQLFALADALERNPRWLATGAGQPAPPVELDPERASEEERLLNAWRRLDPEQQAHVVNNAELLLGVYMVPRLKLGREEPLSLHDKDRGFKGDGE